MFFSKKTMPRCGLKCIGDLRDVVVGGIAKRAVGLPLSERRELLRQLRSADPEQAKSARMTLDGVYLQLLLGVANQYQPWADCVGLSQEELIRAGRKGALAEMREPQCRLGEKFAHRVLKAAQQAMEGLLEEKTNGYCAN